MSPTLFAVILKIQCRHWTDCPDWTDAKSNRVKRSTSKIRAGVLANVFSMQPMSLLCWPLVVTCGCICGRGGTVAGCRLASIWGTRFLTGDYICRQDEYAAETTAGVSRVEDNLPEIVRPLVAPLYERFSFFQLPSTLVSWRDNPQWFAIRHGWLFWYSSISARSVSARTLLF